MQHGQLLRLVFEDGLTEVGAYNAYSSTQHWFALAGFMRRFYRDHIVEIFAHENGKWSRKKGTPSLYDDYIANGGSLTTKEFFQTIYEDDI